MSNANNFATYLANEIVEHQDMKEYYDLLDQEKERNLYSQARIRQLYVKIEENEYKHRRDKYITLLIVSFITTMFGFYIGYHKLSVCNALIDLKIYNCTGISDIQCVNECADNLFGTMFFCLLGLFLFFGSCI